MFQPIGHLATTISILQGFAFLCDLALLLFKPHGITKCKYERKNDKDSGRSSKMTSLCKWPIRSTTQIWVACEQQTHFRSSLRISLVFWATELDTTLPSSICQPASMNKSDQFSFLGNRARYESIELDMSTVLDLSIPSSRPLTFPGEQSKNGYRAPVSYTHLTLPTNREV